MQSILFAVMLFAQTEPSRIDGVQVDCLAFQKTQRGWITIAPSKMRYGSGSMPIMPGRSAAGINPNGAKLSDVLDRKCGPKA